MSKKPPFPIDFVWTFCSSKGNSLQKRHKPKQGDLQLQCPDVPDLKYSLRSALKNANWYNCLYIVISDQDSLPTYLKQNKVKVVRHSQIIPKEFLPTFNSNVIDSYLHKIPGLTEQFVVFNDDTYIGKPTPWYHFFTKSGRPINRHPTGPTRHTLNPTSRLNMFVRMMQNAIKKFNMDNTRYQHQVQPFTKTLITHYEHRFATSLRKASFHRYRRATDFNLLRFTTCFSSTDGLATVKRTSDSYDYFTESTAEAGVHRLSKKPTPRFFCINNTGPGQPYVHDILMKLFPEPSSIESVKTI